MAALAAGGCGSSRLLVPAPDAHIVPGQPKAAAAEAFGVRMLGDAQAWSGEPRNLEELMFPMQVTLENSSGRALRIRYSDFALVASSGFETNPLPPFRLSRRAPSPPGPVFPDFEHTGFFVVPDYERFYGQTVPVWKGPFDYAPTYNATYYQSWLLPLPTPDMLRKAVPEGVLENGGRLSGFLYFHKPEESTATVRLTAALADGNNQQIFGSISIPFLLR